MLFPSQQVPWSGSVHGRRNAACDNWCRTWRSPRPSHAVWVLRGFNSCARRGRRITGKCGIAPFRKHGNEQHSICIDICRYLTDRYFMTCFDELYIYFRWWTFPEDGQRVAYFQGIWVSEGLESFEHLHFPRWDLLECHSTYLGGQPWHCDTHKLMFIFWEAWSQQPNVKQVEVYIASWDHHNPVMSPSSHWIYRSNTRASKVVYLIDLNSLNRSIQFID